MISRKGPWTRLWKSHWRQEWIILHWSNLHYTTLTTSALFYPRGHVTLDLKSPVPVCFPTEETLGMVLVPSSGPLPLKVIFLYFSPSAKLFEPRCIGSPKLQWEFRQVLTDWKFNREKLKSFRTVTHTFGGDLETCEQNLKWIGPISNELWFQQFRQFRQFTWNLTTPSRQLPSGLTQQLSIICCTLSPFPVRLEMTLIRLESTFQETFLFNHNRQTEI